MRGWGCWVVCKDYYKLIVVPPHQSLSFLTCFVVSLFRRRRRGAAIFCPATAVLQRFAKSGRRNHGGDERGEHHG